WHTARPGVADDVPGQFVMERRPRRAIQTTNRHKARGPRVMRDALRGAGTKRAGGTRVRTTIEPAGPAIIRLRTAPGIALRTLVLARASQQRDDHRNHLRQSVHLKLLINAPPAILDGLVAQMQSLRDLLGAQASQNQSDDL